MTQGDLVAIPSGDIVLHDEKTRRSWRVNVQPFLLSRHLVTRALHAPLLRYAHGMRFAHFVTLLGIVGVLGGGGCRVDVTGVDAIAVEATLSDHKAIALVILGGATWGDALMTVTDDAGVVRDVPVAFAGPSGGFLMDVHVAQEDFLFDDSDTALLQIPEGGVRFDDLFGLYDGGGGSIALGLGYCDLQVDNDASVRLVISGACGGMGAARSENWLTLSADGEVTEPTAP